MASSLGCKSEAVPTQRSSEPWDLASDIFAPDSDDDTATEDLDVGGVDAVDGEQDGDDLTGQPCRLLDPTNCGDLKCSPTLDGGGVCQPIANDAVGEGEPCGSRGADDCDARLVCVDSGDGGLRCHAVCDTSGRDTCTGGRTCGDPLPWSSEPVGICR